MPWNRDRILILVGAAIFFFFGAWLFAIPTALEGVGIQLTTPEAFVDVRATYGGLELGLAAFLAVAQARPAWHRAGLLAAAMAIGGFGTARLAGILLAGEGTSLMWFFVVIEACGATLMTWAYRHSQAP